MTAEEKKTKYVVGSRPIHAHHGEVTGEWLCNSPYCEEMAVNAPEDGGPAVVTQGREPWRGR